MIYKYKYQGLVYLLLLTLCNISPAKADTVYLRDGSVVSGQVTQMNDRNLDIQTSFAGTININMEAIKGLNTSAPLTASLRSGDQITGTFTYDIEKGQYLNSNTMGRIPLNLKTVAQLRDINAPSPQEIALEQIKIKKEQEIREIQENHETTVAALQEKVKDKAQDVWSGSLKFGISGAKGNTDEQDFSGKLTAHRKTEFDRLDFSLQGRFENDDGQETKNEIIGRAGAEIDVSDRLYAFTKLTLERDKFEELDLRANLTGGLGYFLIKEDTHELKPRLGAGYEISAFENKANEDEMILSAGYDYKLELYEKLRFTHNFTYLPTIDAPTENYRLDSDAALAYPINDAKTWNLELGLQNQYDSEPAAGVKEMDTYYSLGLSRTFD